MFHHSITPKRTPSIEVFHKIAASSESDVIMLIMIKNPEILRKFEKEDLRNQKTDYLKSLRIFEALWNEGVALGVLPLKDPLEDIETDIRIARILNSQNV